MSRFLGIDFGSKRVGIAISDELGKMAFPHAVFANDNKLVEKLVDLIQSKGVTEVVIGRSLNRDGAPNKVQQLIEGLITDLTLETGLPVHLEPEQYTTQAALRIQGRNEMTDASAATLILDNYLTKKK